ncbi:SUMF1/EgtB/PvdO family nonheme iron enzyme [uncultured Sunxiuqinia sp.]|uniref:type IX secretion system lipoprotein PorK/GldK n=1 Tax=Sunxiuqinia rutila TaxID=1397841 RepID=UPI00260DAA5C|nr:SUMF1/EgtB/PvdO family nonheme iron enzyme [uncultured Sunxiuqinia sp.]
MNKTSFIYGSLALLLFASCKKDQTLNYLYPEDSKPFFEPAPFGMTYIERGSYVMGAEDDELQNFNSTTKRVSVEAFWMDNTEITNNEYRQFVYWVRDSLARTLLAETFPEYMMTEDNRGNLYENPYLNWHIPIEWRNPDFQIALEELYIPEEERTYFRKSIDTRKFIYSYEWIDFKQAAKRKNRYNFDSQSYEGTVINADGQEVPIENRSSFIFKESVPVYPDTLCWIRDYTYSYNEPLTKKYFSHVGFDDYPVIGVNWHQAKAFCHWRTELMNKYQTQMSAPEVHAYRLPTEAEWEYASRGGHERTLYSWGSYYTRNLPGCFKANFKPRRGNYVADSESSTTTMKVGSFDPNDYGLYDMGGNVAEWTSSAFNEAAYENLNDFNPTYEYNSAPDDAPAMKRKVIRGGSWKDVAYYMRNSTRSFEYEDTTKSYIGFRCVRTSFKDEFRQ